MATTDLFQQVYYQEQFLTGESAAVEDFNGQQGMFRAQLSDQFLTSMLPNLNPGDPEFGAQSSQGEGFQWGPEYTGRAFTLTPGQAFLRAGSAANKVQISAGTLYQLTSSDIDGQTPIFIPYTFVGTEEFTIAAGDGVTDSLGSYPNWRVDLLQMKLEVLDPDPTSSRTDDFNDATTLADTSKTQYTRKRIQCTLSVKTGSYGTAAALPTCPDPDDGYCAIGSVGVRGGYVISTQLKFGTSVDGGGTKAYVHDQRMPFRVRAKYVDPRKFKCQSNWSLAIGPGEGNDFIKTSNSSNLAELWHMGPLGRVIAVGLYFDDQGNGAPAAGKVVLGVNYDASPVIHRAFDISTFISTDGLSIIHFTDWHSEIYTASETEGPKYLPSPTCKLGVPFWSNGQYGPIEEKRSSQDTETVKRAGLELSGIATGSRVGHVIFYIAEGL